MHRLAAGDRVGDYVVSRFLAEGGNGAVYVAYDSVSGREVALKLLSQLSPTAAARFEREVQVLLRLDHPGIVQLISHGRIDAQPYLVMELLAGETLEQRLARGPLDTQSAVSIACQIASALGHAHARGVVHRDVKPANVFLCGEAGADAKVLDFGIARRREDRVLTQTGAIIGTPAYMAPEQARGDRGIDARADVFALGCVLYESLSGKQAFDGEQFVAVLAKILLDDPVPLRDVVPRIPTALDALVTQMLAKTPSDRPADGTAVEAALMSIDTSAKVPVAPILLRAPTAITTGEQAIASVMLVQRGVAGEVDATLRATRALELDEVIRSTVERHRASAMVLADGTLLLTLSGHGNVVDQAARAASCALAISSGARDVKVALATGRAETVGQLPIGPAIDRAASVLAHNVRAGEITVDELTARLLDARYVVESGRLLGPRADAAGVRTLLGRPTPCVGREKELALLEATLEECIDESVARAVLVTAPPGAGKSRLQMEFVERARKRGDVAVLIARADPVGGGSPLGLVRQLVRTAAVLREGDPEAEQRARLEKHLGRFFAGDELARMGDFVGELVGLPSREPAALMRAASNDPGAMGEWLRRSFDDWLGARCKARPTLVVIEDLHWGDAPSIACFASALRRRADRPLFVLALSRSEIHDQHPRLWSEAGAQEIRLGGLTRKASERLVRSALGDAIAADAVERIVGRADGNAYYLEELIRSVAEGTSDELPETILAMVQSRLGRLEPDARRLLRAASVFGEVFCQGGVAALLGERAEAVATAIKALVAGEVLSSTAGEKYSGEVEYTFRHGLLREAAYATLKDADRSHAHRAAAAWLENAGEKDAVLLARHYERGGDATHAIPWLARAMQSAVDAGDIPVGLSFVERAVALGADGDVLGSLRALETVARNMVGDTSGALACGRQAIAQLAPGSSGWLTAIGGLAFAAFNRTDVTATREVVVALMGLSSVAPATGPYAFAVYCSVLATAIAGQYEVGRALHERIEASARAHSDADVLFAGYLRLIRLERLAMIDGDLGGALRNAREAMTFVDDAANAWYRIIASIRTGWVLIDIGDYATSESLFRRAIEWSKQRQIEYAVAWSQLWMAKARIYANRPSEALEVLGPLRSNQNAIMADSVGAYFAEALLALGRDEEAASAAREVDANLSPPHNRVVRLTVLARVALRAGRLDEALELAERATACFGQSGEFRTEVAVSRLVHYDVLVAKADVHAADRILTAAAERLAARAGTLDDPAEIEAFLSDVAVNARTARLAHERGVDGPIERIPRRSSGTARR